MNSILIVPPWSYIKKENIFKTTASIHHHPIDYQDELKILENKIKIDWKINYEITNDNESIYKINYEKYYKKYLTKYKVVLFLVRIQYKESFGKTMKHLMKTCKEIDKLKSTIVIISLDKSFYYEFENNLCLEIFNFDNLTAENDEYNEKMKKLHLLIEDRLNAVDSGVQSQTASEPISIPSESIHNRPKSPSPFHNFIHNSLPNKFKLHHGGSSTNNPENNGASSLDHHNHDIILSSPGDYNHDNEHPLSTSNSQSHTMPHDNKSHNKNHHLSVPHSIGSLFRKKKHKGDGSQKNSRNSGHSITSSNADSRLASVSSTPPQAVKLPNGCNSVSPVPKQRAKIVNFRRVLSPDCLQNRRRNQQKPNRVSSALGDIAKLSTNIALGNNKLPINIRALQENEYVNEEQIKYYSWSGNLDNIDPEMQVEPEPILAIELKEEEQCTQTKLTKTTEECVKSLDKMLVDLEKSCQEIRTNQTKKMNQLTNKPVTEIIEKVMDNKNEKLPPPPLRIQRPLSESESMEVAKITNLATQIDASKFSQYRRNSQYDTRDMWRFTRHPLIVTSFFATATYTAPYWRGILATSPFVIQQFSSSLPQYVTYFFQNVISMENIQQASVALFNSAIRNRFG